MPARINHVILKVVETCNLNCTYCYMYHHEDKSYLRRPRIMTDAVYLRTLLMLQSYCRRHGSSIGLSFHGGEPTLLGKKTFAARLDQARSILGPCISGISVQTNATLLDAEWVALFQKYDVSIGVSVDGPAWIHDQARVDHDGRGSHAKVLEGINHLKKANIPFTILCVINPNVPGLEVYRFLRSLNAPVIDLMFPDVSHDHIGELRQNEEDTPVADYLIPIFDTWIAEDNPDVKIRLFWGIIRKLMGGLGITDAFGNPTLSYLVVESDGAIEGNDVLKVCREGMAETGLNVLQHSFDDLETNTSEVGKMVREGIPLSAQCQNCPEKDNCGGGYLPHRYSHAREFDNPSIWCADILKLFGHIRNHIIKSESRLPQIVPKPDSARGLRVC